MIGQTKRKPKLLEHKIFATTIWPTETPGVVELEVARGATRRTFEKDGTFVGEQHESTATLWVNIGDRVVVFGAGSADNTACAEVLAVMPSGYRERLRVRVVAGELAIGTTKGYVLNAKKLGGGAAKGGHARARHGRAA